MKIEQERTTNDNPSLKGSYLAWRVAKAKKRMHDREITRAYNLRARQRPETKH